MDALIKVYLYFVKLQAGLKLKSSEKQCILSAIGLAFALLVIRSYAPESAKDIGFFMFTSILVWLTLAAIVGSWGFILMISAIAEYLKNARKRNSSFGSFLNWVMKNDR